ncbi:MAG: FadR family transcriptional regulator [Thermoflexales bacterium]|nr:FadR family transcriptional regulator [Thermoflexales bacterium]
MPEKTSFPKLARKQTLAEQMAEAIQESILSGQMEPGAALPTEPELAGQFGVSRAVVRDATRILMAQGLVEVQHGRGVFVTRSQNEAFGEALLLALRRVGATAWDVEQFEQMLYPQVAALAAANAADQEIDHLQRLAHDYQVAFAEYQARWWQKEAPPSERERLRAAYHVVIQAVFDATHNQLLRQLAMPLLKLRNVRSWLEDEGLTLQAFVEGEKDYLDTIVDAIAARDPDQARASVASLMRLPPEAIQAMKETPIGEVPAIPLSPISLARR